MGNPDTTVAADVISQRTFLHMRQPVGVVGVDITRGM